MRARAGRWLRAAATAALLASLGACVTPAGGSRSADCHDEHLSRVEAQALLQTLNVELLSHDSATATLEHWCERHHLATPAIVVAERIREVDKPATAELRRALAVPDAEAIRYRHVRLRCGPVVLSEADNWYVPGRLSEEMNRQLDTSDVPFGKVVKPLRFQRYTLESRALWTPLPDGWEMQPRSAACTAIVPPAQVLQHRALLMLPNGLPLSEVIETYSGNLLDIRRTTCAPRP